MLEVPTGFGPRWGAHWTDHQGTNNNFWIKIHTDFAQMLQNVQNLHKMHIIQRMYFDPTLKVMLQTKLFFLSDVSKNLKQKSFFCFFFKSSTEGLGAWGVLYHFISISISSFSRLRCLRSLKRSAVAPDLRTTGPEYFNYHQHRFDLHLRGLHQFFPESLVSNVPYSWCMFP